MSHKKLSPQELASEQTWRKVWQWDEGKAQNLRWHLVEAEVYPPSEMEPGDAEAHEYHDAVMRAEMVDIVGALDYIELMALHRVARLLAIVARDPEVFAHSQRRTVLLLARHGIDTRDEYDINALGITDRTVERLLNDTPQAQ